MNRTILSHITIYNNHINAITYIIHRLKGAGIHTMKYTIDIFIGNQHA